MQGMETKFQNEKRPLVTLALITFRQEAYARAALRSLFNQTYSPLEIVISDDASPDGTYSALQEEAEGYDGPHTLKWHRNETNRGLVGNVVQANSMASGELVVVAAGDDISEPNRVERLVEEWLKAGRPSAICSDAYNIDEKGERTEFQKVWYLAPTEGMSQEDCLRAFVQQRECSMSGCAEAWTPGLFHDFPPVTEGVVTEDCVLALRAWLRKGIGFVPDELVGYRLHDSNIWNMANAETDPEIIHRMEHKKVGWESALFQSHITDLEHARDQGWITPEVAEEMIGVCQYKLWRFEYKKRWLNVGIFKRAGMLLGIFTWNIRYWKLVKWSLEWAFK